MINVELSKFSEKSDPDIILYHFLEDRVHELPDELRRRFERWETVHELIKSGKIVSTSKIVKFLLSQFKGQLGRAQAYNDVFESKAFFGTISRRDTKEYKRGLYVEWLEEWAHKSVERKDFKTAERLLNLASEIQGLKEEDPKLPDYADVKIWQTIFVYDPKLIVGDQPLLNVDELRKKYRKKRANDRFESISDE